MTNAVAVNTVGDELEATAEFCRAQGIGMEVTAFAFSQNLDADLTERIIRHREAGAGISPLISHGPFFDLVATSPDQAIVEVTRKRHTAALQAACEIGVTTYVAHTNFNPFIPDTSYRKNYTQRMLNFWLPLADIAAEHHLVICLENVWEPGPEIQAELIATAAHPSLKATFDNGHALIFSAKPASEWIDTLGAGLAHCHLHDNSGTHDEHLPVGEGRENWPELIGALRRSSPQAIVVAESSRLERNKTSLRRLRGFLSAHGIDRT
jgi:sugar phosphate isomerase/epimerase